MNAYFRGYAPILAFPTESPGGKLGSAIAALRVFPADHVIRKTLAPFAPPNTFVPLTFIDTIASYKHQAFDLGWIDNQGIVTSLDAKLDSAKKYLEQGQTIPAINELEAFVIEVEAQKNTHLNSEPYALLKYNAGYLIAELSK
jgi:hypothetical protein